MKEFLVFRMYAPLSSWGETAVGEFRGSWDRPSRSAVLGMLAAGLGLDREDDTAHVALQTGYGIAVRLDTPGTPMTDYHTTQTGNLSALRARTPATRREYLAMQPRPTSLSRRRYLQDSVATLAVWRRVEARWTLGELSAGLAHPAFVIYAGRKGNPLGAPLAPMIIQADTLAAALQSYPDRFPPSRGWARISPAGESPVEHDACEGFESGMRTLAEIQRRDSVVSRSRWQFAERTVLRSVMATDARDVWAGNGEETEAI